MAPVLQIVENPAALQAIADIIRQDPDIGLWTFHAHIRDGWHITFRSDDGRYRLFAIFADGRAFPVGGAR
jgi:hypothetical protein